MAASNPPVNGVAYIVYLSLQDMANPGSFKATPTLASGDVKVSIDGGTLNNLATLPTNTPAASIWVKVSLSASEMTGDNISVQFIDQTSPKEWADYSFNIQTVAAIWLTPTTAGRTLDVSATGEAGVDWANVGSPTTAVGLSGTTIATTQIVASVSGAVGSVATGGIAAASFVAGAINAAAIANAAIDAATFAADTGLVPVRSNTAAGGAATTITLDASASAVDSFYNGCAITLTGLTGVGQARVITGYVGSTKIATVDRAWATNPDNTTTFAIIADDEPKINSSMEVVAASVTARVTANADQWAGGAIPSPTVTGVPKVDMVDILGTAVSTPATAGILDVNVKNIVNAAAAIDANNLLKVDVEDWKAGVVPAVNVTGVPKVDVIDWLGSAPNALVSSRVDVSVGAMAANVVTAAAVADAAIDRATFAADTGLQTVRSNTAAGGAATTITLDAAASSVDSFYVGCRIFLTGATGVGQERIITGYVGSTQVATVNRAWVTNPNNTTTFAIVADDAAKVNSSLQVVSSSVQGDVTGNLNGTVATLTTYTGDTPQTGDAFARLGAPVLASVSADIAAVKADTAAIKIVTDDYAPVFVGTIDDIPTANTVTLSVGAAADDNVYNGCLIYMKLTGGGAFQVRTIVSYAGGTRTATLDRADFAVFSGGSDPCVIMPANSAKLDDNLDVVAASVVGDVGGNVDGNVVGSVASVAGAVGSVTGAVGSVAGNVGGDVVGSVSSVSGNVGGDVVGSVASVTGAVGSVASGGIVAASFAAGAINAAALAADTGLKPIRSNIVAGAFIGNIMLDGSASAVDGFYEGCLIVITGGTGIGQVRTIVNYKGSTKVVDVDRLWATTPAALDTFVILSANDKKDEALRGVVSFATASTIIFSSSPNVSSVNGYYVGQRVDIISGLGAGQSRLITAYNGATGAATISPNWVTVPNTDETFSISNWAQVSGVPTVADISDGVWDEAIAGHLGAGSTGAALNGAGAAGDPWTTPLPGAYGAGTAGFIVGTDLDAAVSSRLAPTVAGRTLDVAATGEAGLDFDNIKDATGAHTLTNIRVPNVTLTDTLTTYTGNTPQTGDSFARLGAPAGASVSADIAEIEVETDDIASIKTQTDKLAFTVANQIDANVLDWKGATAPAMTGDAFARLGAPVGASISADIAEVEAETDGIASIPTNPLLTSDVRLNHLDADISSRTKPADTQARVTLVDTVTTYTGNTPQTGDSYARLGAPVGASISADIAEVEADVDTVIAGVTVTTNNDKTGYALTAAYDPAKTAAQAGDAMALTAGERTTLVAKEWDAPLTGITTVGSIGKLLKDDIDAAISTRLAGASYTAPDNADILLIKAKTDNLPVAPAAVGDIPTAAAISDAVWDEPIVGHLGAGSTGAALNGAGAAGDPWTTPLPGAYGPGTAGNIIGNDIDAKISSRAQAGDAMALTVSERNAVADAYLDRADAIETGLTPRGAERLEVAAAAGKLSVAGNAVTIRNAVADSKNRITATTDASGERTAVATDVS